MSNHSHNKKKKSKEFLNNLFDNHNDMSERARIVLSQREPRKTEEELSQQKKTD